jgi:hypothetical protein
VDISSYPTLQKAVIAVAHVCGYGTDDKAGSDQLAIQDAKNVLENDFTPEQVQQVETHLATLSEEAFKVVCIGEHTEQTQALPAIEQLTNKMLDEIAYGLTEH